MLPSVYLLDSIFGARVADSLGLVIPITYVIYVGDRGSRAASQRVISGEGRDWKNGGLWGGEGEMWFG